MQWWGLWTLCGSGSMLWFPSVASYGYVTASGLKNGCTNYLEWFCFWTDGGRKSRCSGLTQVILKIAIRTVCASVTSLNTIETESVCVGVLSLMNFGLWQFLAHGFEHYHKFIRFKHGSIFCSLYLQYISIFYDFYLQSQKLRKIWTWCNVISVLPA